MAQSLVCGGAGFLGRHVAARLAAEGDSVTVLDDLSAESSTFECAELAHPNIRKVLGSIGDRSVILPLVAAHQNIVHFASVVGVEQTMSHTVLTMKNLAGTLQIVEALTPEHAVVFGSSADVYGLHSKLYDRPMREDDLMVHEGPEVNRWVYAKVKALEENLIAHSAARSINLRFFNCYGPWMDYPGARRVIPQFIDRALRGLPLQVSGDGSQRRALCYWEDTVDGVVTALRYAERQPAPFTDTFNLGSTETLTVLEAARAVVAAALELGGANEAPPIVLNANLYTHAFDDSWHRTPAIDKAQRILGWAPKVQFTEGLRLTLREHMVGQPPTPRPTSALVTK